MVYMLQSINVDLSKKLNRYARNAVRRSFLWNT